MHGSNLTAVAVDGVGASPDVPAGTVLVLGDDASPLVHALEEAGLTSVAVGGEDALAVVRLAVRQLAELRALRAHDEQHAATERAKGILMASRGIGEREAFELLRGHARSTNRKLSEVVAAVLASYKLLAARPADG
jgi:response regulator NasT